jgi:large subunit ribosomal protein L5
VFPEVDSANMTFQQGMNITIVTNSGDNKAGFALLKHLGMPFRQDEANAKKAG